MFVLLNSEYHVHFNDRYLLQNTIMKNSSFGVWIFIYTLLNVICVIKCVNILVFAPMPFKSHFRGFQPLFKELAGRGHNLTVVSTFPLQKSIENYTDIPITVDESVFQGYY